MELSTSQSIMSASGLIDRISALESQAEYQNDVNSNVSDMISSMQRESIASETRTRNSIEDLEEKFATMLSEMKKQTDRRLDLVDGEKQRIDMQITFLEVSQKEKIRYEPTLASREEFVEKEMGIIPPTMKKQREAFQFLKF